MSFIFGIFSGDAMEEEKRLIEQLIKEVTEQGILEAIGDGISIQDTDFKVLYQNQAHKNFVGDHLGEYCYEVYERRERACEGCPVAMVFKDGKTHTTERSAPTDKGISYFEITASPLKDSTGKIIAGIEIARDITERRKMEERLKIMDWAIESSINAIVLADLEENLTYVNPAFLKLWGYDNDKEVLGSHCTKFWQEKEKTEEILRALRDKGEWSGERVARRKDSSTFVVGLSASMVKDEAGKPICIMASLVDITERKKMEKEVKERIAELEKFYEMAIGREVRMKELKDKIKKLETELSKYRK